MGVMYLYAMTWGSVRLGSVPTAQGCPHGFLGKEAGGVRLGQGVGSRVFVAFLCRPEVELD